MTFIFTTTPTAPTRKERIADWAGTTKKSRKHTNITPTTHCNIASDPPKTTNWKDVSNNIKQMDQFYDATFYAWLKSEENVLVTSIYLHRIANEYPIERITNALEWLTSDWTWESTCILVRHVTVDWCDYEGDIKRATLIRQLTNGWATQYIATLISTLLMSSPYTNNKEKRERFLQEFTKDWDFSKLSEFFMFLKTRANIDYKTKCLMLQEAARRGDNVVVVRGEVELSSGDSEATAVMSTPAHYRRTSNNDFQEMKKSILAEQQQEDKDEPPFNTTAAASSSASTTTSRYHHHPPPTRLSASSSTLAISPTASSSNNEIPSPSPTSSSNNNGSTSSDSNKKRLTATTVL